VSNTSKRIQSTLRFSALVALMSTGLVLAGCSASSSSSSSGGISGFGASVLSKIGLGPRMKKSDFIEAIAKAAQTPNPEQEYYLGRAVAARILSIYPRYNNPALESYLNKLLIAVASGSELPNTFGGYHVVVLDTEDVTAMSAPGGFIFISKGMLLRISNEDVLAAVLAHEVTHVAKQHGLKSIRAGTILDRLLDQGVPLASIDCAQVLLQGSLLFASLVDDLVDNLVQKGYSRDMEFEADAGALGILTYTGFDPGSLDEILHRLEDIEKDKSGGWFSTHPAPSDRIQKADAVLATLSTDEFFKGGLENRNRRFKKVMKAL